MPRRKSLGFRLVSREVVERTAQIMGEGSGAAQALADAAAHDGPVNFYLTGIRSILVEKLPPPVAPTTSNDTPKTTAADKE